VTFVTTIVNTINNDAIVRLLISPLRTSDKVQTIAFSTCVVYQSDEDIEDVGNAPVSVTICRAWQRPRNLGGNLKVHFVIGFALILFGFTSVMDCCKAPMRRKLVVVRNCHRIAGVFNADGRQSSHRRMDALSFFNYEQRRDAAVLTRRVDRNQRPRKPA